MRLKTIRHIRSLKGKRVLLRTDFNVPIGAGGRVDREGDERIRRALPTVRSLRSRGAVTVIATHLGRPEGRPVARYRILPVARYLGKVLGKNVLVAGMTGDAKTERRVQQAKPGDVLMLENLRFDPGEEKNDAEFSKALARLASCYVNDAFGNAHRSHASMVGVPKLLPAYAGLLLDEEVRELSRLLERPARPYAAIIGGVKLSTKLGVIQAILGKVDHLLLGGNLANTVLKASGVAVGRSPVEKSMIPAMRRLKLTSVKLHLPVDVVTAKTRDRIVPTRACAVGAVRRDEYILDIGKDSVRLFDAVIRNAATVVWNGPMGKFEMRPYAAGTIGLVRALTHTRARVVIGGGETVAAVRKYLPKPAESYPRLYLSTGGGAMLKFLEKGTLPALEPLRVR